MSAVEMDRASASRGADSAFGAAAISLSMAAFRWCRVPTCPDVGRAEKLCARAGRGPTAGSASATAWEPTTVSGQGSHRCTCAFPNTRVCAEIKRMTAAAADSAAAA